MAKTDVDTTRDDEPGLRLFGWRIQQSSLDVVLVLTLVITMVSPSPHDPWYMRVAAVNLAICALVFRSLLRSAKFWLVVTLVHVLVFNFYLWEFSDNHKFLLSYWCLAITCALAAEDPDEVLASTSRILVGLVFLFATVWKATSWSYVNDGTFQFLLVTDFRFFPIANILADVTPEILEANRQALAGVRTATAEIALETTPGVAPLATFLTWWTVLLEGVIALAFLVPRVRWLEVGRHILLLGFIASTYPPTNVIQFGWIIVAMGLASCPRSSRRLQLAYLIAFVFIFCFSTGYLRTAFYESVLRAAP